MDDIETQSNSDESSAASSEPQSTAGEGNSGESQNSPVEQSTKQDNVPFHEHPRFKELVEQKNSFAKEVSELRQQLQSLSKSREQAPKEPVQDKMYERLKGIDPEFAEYIKSLKERATKVEELEGELKEFRSSSAAEKVNTAFQSLCEQNKIPESRRPYYEAMMTRQANLERSQGRNLGLQDLGRIFKLVHDEETKYIESLRRDDRKSYVEDKKQAVSSPASQPRGKAVSPSKKEAIPTDPDELMRWTRSEVLKELRSQRSS